MSSAAQAAIATASVLHDIETGQLVGEMSDENKQDDNWYSQFGTVTLLTLGLGIASITLNVLSMVFYQSGVVFVMGIVAVLMAPVVMKRQIDMEDKDGMRKLQNDLRKNVNTLSIENTRLCGQVNEFGEKVQSLKKWETELAAIAKGNNKDIDLLVALVKENGEITAALREAVVADAIHKVIDVFLDSDRDKSASLSEKEIRMLLDVRLAVLEGVTIKTDILEEKLKQDSSLAGIMAVLQASLHLEMGEGILS